MKQSIKLFFMIALMTQFVVSCSNDAEGPTDPGPVTITEIGVFLDAVVEGLTYKSGANPIGTTDNNGRFVYIPGQPLTFSIGGVELGTLADGADLITPYDFVVPENIARFIQSLDADGDPLNGIDLTAASASLVNHNVSSDVFENTSSTGFANDPAITGAMAAAGKTLLDPATANANLAMGTDNTFDPAELAGFAFVFYDYVIDEVGVVGFRELANLSDMGSTGFSITSDEVQVGGVGGTAEEFTWLIDANGVMTLTHDSGSITIVHRVGGSSRSISVTIEENNIMEPLTLLRPAPVTETDLCGAPVTQGGTSTKAFTFTEDFSGAGLVTFKSDGTFIEVPSDSTGFGFWSVGAVFPDFLLFIDEGAPDLFPNDWVMVILLDGDLASGGTILIMDVIFTGYDIISGEPELIWDAFNLGTIVAN